MARTKDELGAARGALALGTLESSNEQPEDAVVTPRVVEGWPRTRCLRCCLMPRPKRTRRRGRGCCAQGGLHVAGKGDYFGKR